MAFVTEYDLTWESTHFTGTIEIKRDGGSYQGPLTLRRGSLEIENTIPDWEDPIGRTKCSFTIVNDFSDFYDLLPLMTIENGEYQVVVTNDTNSETIFAGYINCEAVDQAMLQYADLTITASGLLSKLENNHPDSVDTLQYISLFDLMDDCLRLTGTTYNILISCDLYETSVGDITDTTLFNQTAVWTEVFWKNNVERMSALEILRSILKTFNCYIVWGNLTWRIEHYQNLNTNKHYIYYYSGSSYSLGDTGIQTDVTITPEPIWSNSNFKQIGGTQRLSVIPGLREFEIRLNDKIMDNLFYPDLTGIIEKEDVLGLPWDRRTWYAQETVSPQMRWSEAGEPFKDITNAIKRYGSNLTGLEQQLNGLTTRFSASITEESIIAITFKFGVPSWAYSRANYDSAFTEKETDMKITFYWYLSNYIYPGARDFYVYDEATDTWSVEVAGSAITDYNTLEISAADLDPDLGTYTGTLKIRIGEVISDSSADIDSMDFVFRMGTESRSGFPTGFGSGPFVNCYYGDFNCVVNGTKSQNYFSGVITTDFLNKKTLSLDLFDGLWQNRGALAVPDTIEYLTSTWADANDPSIYDSLVDFLMTYKFRLYRVARQIITMDVTMLDGAASYFNLMFPFVDSKQSNKIFILLSEIMRPDADEHTLKLYEYDDTEDITLS